MAKYFFNRFPDLVLKLYVSSLNKQTEPAEGADLAGDGCPLRHLGILPPGGTLPVPETGLEGGLRLIFDGTHEVLLNHRIRVRDKVAFPGLGEARWILR